MALLYLQQTRNMTSTMANKDKLSLDTRFNNEDNLNIERLQPFGRIGFVTTRSRMKKKLDKRSYKAIMVGIPKHHSNNNYYMYNVETKRIIISRDIRWAPFTRPSFYEGLDEVIRPDTNREDQDENIQQINEDEEENESNPEKDINLGGGNDLDDTQDEIEEMTQPEVRGIRMRHELKTDLNPEYFTPKHATRRSTDNDEIHILEDEQIESVYNTAIISDPNTPLNIDEALKGKEKDAWRKPAELEINNFIKRGSWEKFLEKKPSQKAER